VIQPTHDQEVCLRHVSVGLAFAMACAGAVVVAACSVATAPPTGLCNQVSPYVVGDTARDSLATGDCQQSDGTYIDFHNFTMDAQTGLRISLSSPTNAAILQVFDSRGAIIANSFVQTGIADTSASVRLILAGGTYGIGVRGAKKGGKGPYRLIATTDTAVVGGCGYLWVTPGTTMSQRIVNTDCATGPGGPGFLYHVYTIVLLPSQSLDITEHSTAFTPQMYFIGATGSTSSSVDSTGTNAGISFLNAGQGAYQLWVGGSTTAALGPYTLTLQ